jgi:glycosyltransferase involved in cell wall biosynthesis
MTVETLWDDAAHAATRDRIVAAAASLGGDVIVACDLGGLAAALLRLIAARRAGELAALFVSLADPREALVATVYAQAAANDDPEQRDAIVDGFSHGTLAVNGKALGDYAALDRLTHRTLYAALRLADVVLIGSAEHARRLEAATGRPPNRMVFIGGVDADDVPLPSGRRVVVYAPSMERDALRQFDVLFANRDFAWSTIARDNSNEPVPCDVAVAVAPAWTSPEDAYALRAQGVRVVAPFSSGAPALGLAFGYDPLRAKTLYRAVDAALTEPAPLPLALPRLGGLLARERALRTEGPRLSVIVRTYDRPALLLRALDSLGAQTYRDIEAVVINDAGPDIAPLLERYEDRLAIRYVRLERNGGVTAALNHGARTATGVYVGYLDDDDLWYPDHAARLVDALERTGAGLAYSNCVAEYADVVDGRLEPREYAIFTDHDFVKDAFLHSNLATIHSFVHRRELFDRVGLFDESMAACEDWEMWLRMSRTIDFVHVDRVTVEYSWRRDASATNMTSRSQRAFARAHVHVAQKHAALYARRPSLLQARYDTATHFNTIADRLETEPALAQALFAPPDPAV